MIKPLWFFDPIPEPTFYRWLMVTLHKLTSLICSSIKCNFVFYGSEIYSNQIKVQPEPDFEAELKAGTAIFGSF